MKQNLLKLGMICLMLVFSFIAKAEDIKEKAIYSTDFSEWTDASAATSESKVTVKNKYTKEAFDFILYNTTVKSANDQAKLTKATGGYLQAPKTSDTYVKTSAIPSITKVHFMHGATGGSRGYKLECKGDGDADWVTLSDSYATTQAGTDVTVNVNRTNVQLRFTNLTPTQYAFLLKLDIYANVDMDNVAEKENYTLNYYNIDGSTVIGTQSVTEDEAIGTFSSDAESKVTVADGQKFRGWCTAIKTNPKKYTTKDIVTGNLSLYPLVTEIESANPTARYDYDLKDQYFDADDHEAFSVTGNGKWHDTAHGWIFSSTDKIKVLMGGKGYIKLSLCQYSGSGNIILTSPNGTQIASATVKVTADGATAVLENTSEESGEYTLSFDGSGSNYLHSLSIINMAEPAYTQNGNWYTVKAGDGKSLITTLELVSGYNAAADAPRAYIFLPNGTYDFGETALTTISGNNISLIGESMDKTIIVNKPAVENEGIGTTATILNTGKNLYMQDLTLQNALDYYNADDKGRAVCLQDRGTKTVCKNVKMLSYQDTYYSNEPTGKGQYYFEDSEIHGTVDYLCGGGDAYFNRVLLVNESRKADSKYGEDVIAAPNSKSEWGYIFKDCTIENKASNFSLGRSWDNITRLTWLNTTVNQKDEIKDDGKKVAYFTIDAMGNYAANKFRLDVLKDAEGNVFSPSEKMVAFTSTKAGITKAEENIILTADEAAGYSLDKVFTDWTPATLAAQKETISAKVENGKLTWTGDAQMYMVEKNGEFAALTSETSYDIDDASAKYEVRAANEMGGFNMSESTATGIEQVISANDAIKTVIYSVDGIQLSHLQKGINIIVKTLADGSKKTSKVIVK